MCALYPDGVAAIAVPTTAALTAAPKLTVVATASSKISTFRVSWGNFWGPNNLIDGDSNGGKIDTNLRPQVCSMVDAGYALAFYCRHVFAACNALLSLSS